MRHLTLAWIMLAVGCGSQKPIAPAAAHPPAAAGPARDPAPAKVEPAGEGKTRIPDWNVELDFAPKDLQVQAGKNDVTVVNSWEGHKTVGDAVFQLTMSVEKEHVDSAELAKTGRIQIAANGFNPDPAEPAELMGVPGLGFTAVNPKGIQLYMFIAMQQKCSYTLMIGPAESHDAMLEQAKEMMGKIRPVAGAAAVPARCQ
jgi:hypothetical protein